MELFPVFRNFEKLKMKIQMAMYPVFTIQSENGDELRFRKGYPRLQRGAGKMFYFF